MVIVACAYLVSFRKYSAINVKIAKFFLRVGHSNKSSATVGWPTVAKRKPEFKTVRKSQPKIFSSQEASVPFQFSMDL